MTMESPGSGRHPDAERAFGLLLFEAEETLARGAAEKALVLASRAVKERPDSLTARALMDRARRELLRGRRRERLEARLKEARELLESGEDAAAEKIVNSALKIIPDHAVALELFGRIKERRLGAGTAEAEAERELARLDRAEARRALDAAKAALAAGWNGRALLALRRGLRLVPDDPELLALLKEAQRGNEARDAERARRHALLAQVRDGLERLQQGQLDESLQVLRAVLREDPDNARAQAGVQEVRRAWLEKQAAPAATLTRRPTPPPLAPVAQPGPVSESMPPRPPPRRSGTISVAAPARSAPVEILLPRTRRRATPFGLILAVGSLLAAGVVFVVGRSGRTVVRRPVVEATLPATPETPRPAGPLASVEPELRAAIEGTLAAYGRALETADAAALAAARPDLGAEAREARLAPFRGALNAAADLRVVDVQLLGDVAVVEVRASDVIVGGRQPPRPPVNEMLRFERRPEGWRLGAAR
jgi:tetratricopeptide (TPR) repeat protein